MMFLRENKKKIIFIASAILAGCFSFIFGFVLAGKVSSFSGAPATLNLQISKYQNIVDGFVDNQLSSIKNQATDIISLAPDFASSSNDSLSDYSAIKKAFLASSTDFAEINFPEMAVRVFKKGKLTKKAEILMRGDPYEWGGTAAGVYKINRGYPEAYSVVAEVYMPDALSFYGKYFIHGEPYYADGTKRITDASGGCVQLADKDAADIYEATEINMPVVVIDKLNDDYHYETSANPVPNVTAVSFLVADLDSGSVIAEKNSREVRPIASLTKLMTAVVVAEQVDLRKSIVITEDMMEGFGESEIVQPNMELRVVELFYPLLIESCNDAAEALSRFLGRNWMISLMNQKAQSMMMKDTHFACPSGYDPANVSTARDLFYLARYISNNRPLLWQISRSKQVRTFGGLSFDVASLWNKNVFVEDPTFIGGKVGYIQESLYNGIYLFQFTDENEIKRNVAIILLGSSCLECSKADTQKLYIWLQRNYFPLTGVSATIN